MNQKKCLVVFRNKKLKIFDRENKCVSDFASKGIYFDRIVYAAFDDTEEITRCLNEIHGAYSDIVILCPYVMHDSVKSFCEKFIGGQFDNFDVLTDGRTGVYLISSDTDSRLKESDVASIISKRDNISHNSAYIKTVGVEPTALVSAISKAKEICPECDFNVSDSYSDCTIEIVYSDEVLKSDFDNMWRTLIGELNEHIYALENISLGERLFQLLQLRRMKISVAESFTGGGVAKRLVEVPGISEVYFEGLNTYSNESKMNRLGVDELILKQYGAVSEQTAYGMAEGLLKTGDCNIAVATTGIAGPKSDNTFKPVGLVYIAVGTEESVSVYKYELNGGRKKITETAINLALFHTFKKLK